jgi:hypothetical protein
VHETLSQGTIDSDCVRMEEGKLFRQDLSGEPSLYSGDACRPAGSQPGIAALFIADRVRRSLGCEPAYFTHGMAKGIGSTSNFRKSLL